MYQFLTMALSSGGPATLTWFWMLRFHLKVNFHHRVQPCVIALTWCASRTMAR